MKLLFLSLSFILLVTSCSVFRGDDYDGYMTRDYTIRGIRYYPMTVAEALHYEEVGTASWYDESKLFGIIRGNTSLGERVMPWHMSAAHKTLPLPCKVKVTNLQNGRSVVCRVNDRGPFIGDRIIDLTPRAADDLKFKNDGLAQVKVEVLSVGDGKYKRKIRKRFFFF